MAARAYAVLVLLGCILLLGTAAWLRPDPTGMGTHQQLGLPPCSMTVLAGYPCPTCGMTTAFAHTVRGEFVRATLAQPFGFLLALATIAAVGLSLSVVVTGRVWTVNWYRVSPKWVMVGVVAALVGGWVMKIVMGLADGTVPLAQRWL